MSEDMAGEDDGEDDGEEWLSDDGEGYRCEGVD